MDDLLKFTAQRARLVAATGWNPHLKVVLDDVKAAADKNKRRVNVSANLMTEDQRDLVRDVLNDMGYKTSIYSSNYSSITYLQVDW